MKSLLKYSSLLVVMITTLTLSACGQTEPEFDITLEDGDELLVESDVVDITKQELFEVMATGTIGEGSNNAVETILNWADHLILSELFEIDEEAIEASIDEIREFEPDNFEEFLIRHGFRDVEELVVLFELEQLRHTAALEAVELDEEEILEFYNMWFVPEPIETEDDADSDEDSDVEEDTDSDEDSDVEEDTDSNEDSDVDEDTDLDEDSDVEEAEYPTLEEVREEIEAILTGEALTSDFVETELARLRAEAGFTIFSNYLDYRYNEFLEIREADIEAIMENAQTANRNDFDSSVVAVIGENEFTSDLLFDRMTDIAGIIEVLSLVDQVMLHEEFEVDEDEVNDQINSLKIHFADQFYPTMKLQGLMNDQEIFDYIEFMQIRELAFLDAFTPDEERLEELKEEFVPYRRARHILVEEEDFALELIERLEAAEEDEVKELFAELAEEYSSDVGSAQNGGSLHDPFTMPSPFVPEFEEEAFSLNEGEFSAIPVESEFGFHILFIDTVYEDLPEDFGDFGDLEEYLINTEIHRFSNQERLDSVLMAMRSRFNLTFNNERMQERYDAMVTHNTETLEAWDSVDEDEE